MKSVLNCVLDLVAGSLQGEFWVPVPLQRTLAKQVGSLLLASWPGLRDMKGFGVEASRGKSEMHPNQCSERTGRGRTVQKDDTNHVSHRGDLRTATGLCLRGRSDEGDKERATSQSQWPRKAPVCWKSPARKCQEQDVCDTQLCSGSAAGQASVLDYRVKKKSLLIMEGDKEAIYISSK